MRTVPPAYAGIGLCLVSREEFASPLRAAGRLVLEIEHLNGQPKVISAVSSAAKT